MPAERHVHYDADGNPTGYTVVERESRVNDADRVELLALAQHDADIGPCGYHPIIAEDPDNVFTPETQTCPVCAAMDLWNRILGEQDQAQTEAPPDRPRKSDGRRSYMRLMTRQEAERVNRERSTQPTDKPPTPGSARPGTRRVGPR